MTGPVRKPVGFVFFPKPGCFLKQTQGREGENFTDKTSLFCLVKVGNCTTILTMVHELKTMSKPLTRASTDLVMTFKEGGAETF